MNSWSWIQVQVLELDERWLKVKFKSKLDNPNVLLGIFQVNSLFRTATINFWLHLLNYEKNFIINTLSSNYSDYINKYFQRSNYFPSEKPMMFFRGKSKANGILWHNGFFYEKKSKWIHKIYTINSRYISYRSSYMNSFRVFYGCQKCSAGNGMLESGKFKPIKLHACTPFYGTVEQLKGF